MRPYEWSGRLIDVNKTTSSCHRSLLTPVNNGSLNKFGSRNQAGGQLPTFEPGKQVTTVWRAAD